MTFAAWVCVNKGVAYSVQFASPPGVHSSLRPAAEAVAKTFVIQQAPWTRGSFAVQLPQLRARLPLCDLNLHPVQKVRAAVKRVPPSDVLLSLEPAAGDNDAPFGMVVCACAEPASSVLALPHSSDAGDPSPFTAPGGVACATMTYCVPPECRGQGLDCVAAWRSDLPRGDRPVAVVWNRQPKELKDEDHDTLLEFRTVMRDAAVEAVAGSEMVAGDAGPIRFEQRGLGLSFEGAAAGADGAAWAGRVTEMRYGDVKLVYRPEPASDAAPEMQVIEPWEIPESLAAWTDEMLKDLASGSGTLMNKDEGELDGVRVAKVVGRADLPPEAGAGPGQDNSPRPVVLVVTLVWRDERPFLIRWACMEPAYAAWRERMDRVTATFRFTAPAPAPVAPQAPAAAAHVDPCAASGSPPKAPAGAAVAGIAGMAAQRVAALQQRKPKPAAKAAATATP